MSTDNWEKEFDEIPLNMPRSREALRNFIRDNFIPREEVRSEIEAIVKVYRDVLSKGVERDHDMGLTGGISALQSLKETLLPNK